MRIASSGHSTRSACPMSGNSTRVMLSLSSAIFRAPSPDGARSGGHSTSWVPFVISSGREICGTSGDRSMFSIARHACRTVYGSLSPTMSRTSWRMFSPSGLSMNLAPTACVVTWSEKSSQGIDSTIRRQTRKSVRR